jgi:hypothetical protein
MSLVLWAKSQFFLPHPRNTYRREPIYRVPQEWAMPHSENGEEELEDKADEKKDEEEDADDEEEDEDDEKDKESLDESEQPETW